VNAEGGGRKLLLIDPPFYLLASRGPKYYPLRLKLLDLAYEVFFKHILQ
jgi:hypothetical protein